MKNIKTNKKSGIYAKLKRKIQSFNVITRMALVILAVLLAGAILAGAFKVAQEKMYGRQAMNQEINSLPVVPGCREQSRHYLSPGIDTQSSWSVLYDCNAIANQPGAMTVGQAHDSLVTALKQDGYKAVDDTLPKAVPGEISSHRFIYRKGHFEADYTISSSWRIKSADEVLAGSVTGVDLQVTYK